MDIVNIRFEGKSSGIKTSYVESLVNADADARAGCYVIRAVHIYVCL